jgi:hypothetical protein
MRINRSTLLSMALVGGLVATPAVMVAQATPMATPLASPVATPVSGGFGELRVIGVQTVANDLTVDDPVVGGLSGIDYDAANGVWYVLSDDRSEMDPAHFYIASLDYTSIGFDRVSIDGVTTLLQENGEPYPNEEAGGNVPDPESVRLDPQSGTLWYTSEGNQELGIDPFIAEATADGQLIARPTLPELFAVDPAGELGPRNNLVFEGLSFASDGASLWLAAEGPLFQDGEVATAESGALVRLTNIDRDGNVLGQVAYELDALPEDPEGRFGTTGVTEILAVDATRFLVIERATVENADGVFNNFVKVYEVDLTGATDTSTMTALVGEDVVPVSKRLVLDLNVVGVEPVDNIEGMAWGPALENGNRSLVLVSDNNFNETQVQQFIALEVAG